MKNYIKIIVCLICVNFISCEPKCTDDPNLNTNELEWLSYNGGEVLIFKSNTGLLDTGNVGTRVISESVGETDGNGCVHYYQSARIPISFTSNVCVDENGFGLYVAHYNQWCTANLNSQVFQIGNIASEYKFSNYSPQNNILINNISYNNVYIVTIDTSHWTPGPEGLWRIYYTKQNGILEYDWTQGVQWVKIN